MRNVLGRLLAWSPKSSTEICSLVPEIDEYDAPFCRTSSTGPRERMK